MTATTQPGAAAPGTRHQEQTFLVGEEIYLRTLEPGDEKYSTSWRRSIFPVTPEGVEKWIKEELPTEGKSGRGYLAIVRKHDDVIVGGIRASMRDLLIAVQVRVDPLYGEQGDRWLAEAMKLYAEWQVDENFFPSVMTFLDSSRPVAIELLKQAGFVETVRFREAVQRDGERHDEVQMQYFSKSWVERIGNPMDTELPRTGSGEITPVPVFRAREGDPPKNAVMIGKRVYLRPQDKQDAKRDVEMARMEVETFIDIGRQLESEASWASFIDTKADEAYPNAVWFTVCLLENDEAIGTVGVFDVDWVNRTAESGSTFHAPQYRGKGYGTEAKQLLLEYMFETLGFHMLKSSVYFSNTRSAAALRKQGYREAGRWCWSYPYEGGFGNMVTFDLLASEWRALPREDAWPNS